MADQDVKFGTSGVRGPAATLLAGAASDYAAAFLRHLQSGADAAVHAICIGRDLRASSPGLANAVTATALAAGLDVFDAGAVPSPALAHFAFAQGLPSIMVTGSHIPADRNGLKFFSATGEITKADETAIMAQLGQGVQTGKRRGRLTTVADRAMALYRTRYDRVLPPGALRDQSIGIFAHSTVLAQDLAAILTGLGAEVTMLGRSAEFVPVDTEAFDDPVFAPLPGWIGEHGLDALVSADGDGDRPLIMDETGQFVRGDALGALAARALDASCIATPVTANSGLEAALAPARLVRTRVGSPFVLAAMETLGKAEPGPILGFEANGGLMLGTSIGKLGLAALPTRDAILPLLLALGAARARGHTVSTMVEELGLRAARAGRVGAMPEVAAEALMASLAEPEFAKRVLVHCGPVVACDATDGLRFTLGDGAIVHFRRSGNAPEMRCYSEASQPVRADDLLDAGLAVISRARAGATG